MGTAGAAGGGIEASLWLTVGARGLEGTGSGRSGAVNFASLAWFMWIVRSNPPSS